MTASSSVSWSRFSPPSNFVNGHMSTIWFIYAVANSRMDYCNTVLASAPKTVTDKLQRVLNAAARVITGTRKFDWSDTARPTALAWRSRPGSLQAISDSSPVSQRPRTTVSVGALHPGLQCWHVAVSAFSTAFPAQHLRPLGILSCWPDGLELTPRFYPGSNEQHRLF